MRYYKSSTVPVRTNSYYRMDWRRCIQTYVVVLVVGVRDGLYVFIFRGFGMSSVHVSERNNHELDADIIF